MKSQKRKMLKCVVSLIIILLISGIFISNVSADSEKKNKDSNSAEKNI